MRTRLLISVSAALALALLLAPKGLAPQEDLLATLTALEESYWEGWKNHDGTPVMQHSIDNVVSIGKMGVRKLSKQDQMKRYEEHTCYLKSYSFSDRAVHRVSEDVAIVTYRLTVDETCDGVKSPENEFVSAVYVRRNGKWMYAALHHTPAEM